MVSLADALLVFINGERQTIETSRSFQPKYTVSSKKYSAAEYFTVFCATGVACVKKPVFRINRLASAVASLRFRGVMSVSI
jgi:hypothetical protein